MHTSEMISVDIAPGRGCRCAGTPIDAWSGLLTALLFVLVARRR